MKDEVVSDALLRQFLLGKLDEEETQRIERLLFTDSAMRERVLIAEQELAEEYLEDSLSPADRNSFLLYYAQTPGQQRKLRIAKSIKDWAIEEAARSESEVTNAALVKPSTSWSRLRDRIRLRPLFIVPIAVLAIVVIVFLAVLFTRWMEQRRFAALEQQIAILNSASGLREVPPRSDPLTLKPLTVRSAESAAELKPRADVPVPEVRLLLTGKERYPTYQVFITRFGHDRAITLSNVGPESDGKTIRLRIPNEILTRGVYQIQVSGRAADGSLSASEEYQFTVRE